MMHRNLRLFSPIIILPFLLHADLTAQTWTQVYPSWLAETCTSITRARGDTAFITGLNFTLQRTTDAGATWQTRYQTPGAYDIWRSGWDGKYLWLLPGGQRFYDELVKDSTRGFLFRYNPISDDTTRIDFPISLKYNANASYYFSLSVTTSAMFVTFIDSYAAEMHLIRSMDRGSHWTELPLPDSLLPGVYSSISFCDSTHGLLIANVRSQTGRYSLWSTTNAGRNWVPQTTIHFVGTEMNRVPLEFPVTWVDVSTAFAISDGYSLMISRDSGRTFNTLNSTLPTSGRSLRVTKNGFGYLAGPATSVFRTTDSGRSWVRLRDMSLASYYSQLCIMGDSIPMMITNRGERFRSTDAGTSWSETQVNKFAAINHAVFLSTETGYMYAKLNTASLDYGYFASSDEGRSWEPLTLPGRAQYILPVDDHRVYAFGVSGPNPDSLMFISTNRGLTWRELRPDIIPLTLLQDQRASVMHQGTDTLYLRNADSIMVTTDGGAHWISRRMTGLNGSSIFMDFSHPPNAWALGVSTLHRSTDMGTTWQTVFQKPTDMQRCTRMVVLSGTAVIVYGTKTFSVSNPEVTGLISRTDDAGATWTSAFMHGASPSLDLTQQADGTSVGLRNSPEMTQGGTLNRVYTSSDSWATASIGFLHSDDPLDSPGLCFFDARRGWMNIGNRLYVTTTGGIDAIEPPPKPSFHFLGENYPNPARAIANIPFTLHVSENVRFEMYDVLGHLVRVLIDEHRSAGAHVLTFSTNGLHTGVYFIRMQTPSSVHMRPLLLE